jgi:hypothetical protein
VPKKLVWMGRKPGPIWMGDCTILYAAPASIASARACVLPAPPAPVLHRQVCGFLRGHGDHSEAGISKSRDFSQRGQT